MKVLIICGVFAKENEREVMAHARGGVEFSANLVQQKLIRGFRAAGYDTRVLSAPFVGAFPMRSDLLRFRGFRKEQDICRYVPFWNLWGLRNFSRSHSLKRAVRSFAAEPDPEKQIIVYCPHTPFLEAAVYAKKMDPRIRICLYVPDLPGYMNLAENRSRVYDFFKKYDIASMTALMEQVDSFVLLTGQMKDSLPVDSKPCMVAEGIVDAIPPAMAQTETDGLTRIVYTGKLNRKFGIPQLLEGFSLLEDPSYRLILCGAGDCDADVAQASCRDPRICHLGQVSPEEAAALQRSASVLVNPRPNNEAYTRYSFPSKVIEYLLTGRPVAAYLLDGMPEAYGEFLFPIAEGADAPRKIADALEAAIRSPEPLRTEKYRSFLDYAEENLMASGIARSIIAMNQRSEET